jgi:hypothetical protein
MTNGSPVPVAPAATAAAVVPAVAAAASYPQYVVDHCDSGHQEATERFDGPGFPGLLRRLPTAARVPCPSSAPRPSGG